MKIFSKALLDWYHINKRDLPWRKSSDPYRIWISEIMLQQTGVETVIPYYLRFIKQFPTIEDLAKSELQEVLSFWQGLGYYSRAKNLYQCSQLIKTEYMGVFPSSYQQIRQLPGIGDYTSASLCAIAFDQKISVIDGNVLRILSRLFEMEEDISNNQNKKIFLEKLNSLLPESNNRDFAQALMELGALICRPTNPVCYECPVKKYCKARENGTIINFPVKGLRKAKIIQQFSYIVINYKDYIFLKKRKSTGLLADMWELVLISSNEDQVISHSLRKLFGKSINSINKYPKIKHVFTHIIWELNIFKKEVKSFTELCYTDKTPRNHVYKTAKHIVCRIKRIRKGEYYLIPIAELSDYPLPAIIQKILLKTSKGHDE